MSVCASLRDIVYVRLAERHGVSYARAAGMAASRGSYISFLDDDDARLPGSIDKQAAILDASADAGLVYGPILRATQSLTIDGPRPFPRFCPDGDVFWRLVAGNFIALCSVLVRRSAIDSVGGFDQATTPAEDWDLWLRIAERHPIMSLPEPVAIYRQPTLWSDQGSSRLADGLLVAAFRVLDRCATLPRAMADPSAFRRAAGRAKRSIALRLVMETLQATLRFDSYAFVSLRHASSQAGTIATPSFLLTRGKESGRGCDGESVLARLSRRCGSMMSRRVRSPETVGVSHEHSRALGIDVRDESRD